MSEFAFIQTSPGLLHAGWGPFSAGARHDQPRAAFYVNDYFLEDPDPWKYPTTSEELSPSELADRFPPSELPQIGWESPSPVAFESLFRSAHSSIERGGLRKVVPVMFESGLFEAPADRLVSHIVRRMQSLSEPARAFGWSAADKGILGATPEVLFSTDGVRFTTMALAGTRPSARAEELLDDPKERDEHQIVIEDIKDRLQPDGAVTVGRTGVMVFSGLAHLLTDITFEPPHPQRFGFDEMIRRLHPTAALGASPRSDESARWLREADRGVGRGFFGAPFGFQRADGSGLCIVAIRSLTWRGGLARIGSGAGIVSQSSMDAEFEELRRKREQVKRLLGLDGGSV